MGKYKPKRFTKQEIELLSRSPYVKTIRENRLSFTLEFRKEMYEVWVKNQSVSTIRKFIEDHGISSRIVGSKYIGLINKNFIRYGKPTNGSSDSLSPKSASFRSNDIDNKYLLSTGVFVKKRIGISFSDEFISEVCLNRQLSIEEHLKLKGINPEIVGYQRIITLKRKIDNNGYKIRESEIYSKEFIDKYINHPYVKTITNKHFSFKDAFYKDAIYFINLDIDEILKIFNFDSDDFSYTFKANTLSKIRNNECKDVFKEVDDTAILTNRINKLNEMIENNYETLKPLIKQASKLNKKEIIKLINENFNSKQKIETANKLGISRSCFYSTLKNDNYGLFESNREKEDDISFSYIKKVLDLDPYPMGKRTIYMKMDDICHFHYSIKKISRLLNKYDCKCKVRQAKLSAKETRELIKRNTKPNILKRRFRIGKPLEVLLTDVTYLEYGTDKTAYKSSIKDGVTGRILGCVISDSNDLNMALDTVDELNDYTLHENVLLNSDQGVLYLSDVFQSKLKELNIKQSMSKRGNSQDNSSKESYFGHFKDECDYSSCNTIEEVKEKVDKYIDYYNNRRPQWTRNKMTPVKYEEYLNSLSNEEYDNYLKIEEEKYQKMKERAKAKAIERNKTLGV